MAPKTHLYKICIVGDWGVGKSTLLHRYLEKRFISNVQSTIGSNFFVKRIKIPNVQNHITLQIWDLAGQDHFRWVRQAFYKGAKGIVYVFDLSREDTRENISSWKEEVERAAGFLPNVLVGNKLDLINSGVEHAPDEQSLDLKRAIRACMYSETSAKTGIGVDNVFLKLTKEMDKKFNR
jgi:small GTP-binding protein